MKEAGTLPIRQSHPLPNPPSVQRPIYEDVEVDAPADGMAASSGGSAPAGPASPFQRNRLAPPSPPQEDPRTYDNIDPKNTELPAFLRKRNRRQ